ncbi:MAG: type II toxin-antitoxin system VapC family toxin [Candidatus Sumerlaeota bacterium]|nr:type II toxin-antitoxin system VapC family toxin [Candidatus Sumerlaeota bacterium]
MRWRGKQRYWHLLSPGRVAILEVGFEKRNMKKRIYIETTVVSYFTARPSRDLLVVGHQQATHELWPMLFSEYETYVSALVYEEAGKGDPSQAAARLEAIRLFRMLDVDEKARALSEKIVAEKGIPDEYPEDALHIAIAAINGIQVIVTWNFAHINNPFTRMMVRQSVENEGYSCPEICSPEELLEVDK